MIYKRKCLYFLLLSTKTCFLCIFTSILLHLLLKNARQPNVLVEKDTTHEITQNLHAARSSILFLATRGKEMEKCSRGARARCAGFVRFEAFPVCRWKFSKARACGPTVRTLARSILCVLFSACRRSKRPETQRWRRNCWNCSRESQSTRLALVVPISVKVIKATESDLNYFHNKFYYFN